MMERAQFALEFTLRVQGACGEEIKNALCEFGEGLTVNPLPKNSAAKSQDFKVFLTAEDPTLVFDACAQFGRIVSIKVDEIKNLI